MNNPLKNRQDTWTDTSPEKICTSWITIWKVAQHHVKGQKMRKGICKLKWDTTAHQLEWPNPKQWQNLKGARMWTNRNSYLLLVQCKTGQALWKTVGQFLRMLSTVLPHDPQLYSSTCSQGKCKKYPAEVLCANIHVSIIQNRQKVETTQILSPHE